LGWWSSLHGNTPSMPALSASSHVPFGVELSVVLLSRSSAAVVTWYLTFLYLWRVLKYYCARCAPRSRLQRLEMSGLTVLASLRQKIWAGKVPLEIHLAPQDCKVYDQTDPFIVSLLPRYSHPSARSSNGNSSLPIAFPIFLCFCLDSMPFSSLS
jgi:hypothetical protein